MICADRERRHDEFIRLMLDLESSGVKRSDIAKRIGYAKPTAITNMKNAQFVISSAKLVKLRELAEEYCK